MSNLTHLERSRRTSVFAPGLLAVVLVVLQACADEKVPRYDVGGTIHGLSTAGLVLALGLDILEPEGGATEFAFGTALPRGASYQVRIAAQPDGQTCSIRAGTESGTMGKDRITSVVVDCLSQWIWQAGSDVGAAEGVFGTMQGVASPDIWPGARQSHASWTDSAGNYWVFGGSGYDASGIKESLNDLWRFSPDTGHWTWQGGSTDSAVAGSYGVQGTPDAANMPGARHAAATWVDSTGDFWLFGGNGYDSDGTSGYLQDLWRYSPATGEWTWMAGPSTVETTSHYGTKGTAAPDNLPGGRGYCGFWIDASDNLWLFGGYGYDAAGHEGRLNDLWKYSTATGEWTWVSGSDRTGASGTYGTVASNVPGARNGVVSWTDVSGHFWLFGGYGVDSTGSSGYLNDLWEYVPATTGAGRWNFVSGSSTRSAPGVYGSPGLAADDNVPGARWDATGWVDDAGNLWLFGGYGSDSQFRVGYLNDLWKYSASLDQWSWMSGADDIDVSGVYGTLGTRDVGSSPGGRSGSSAFADVYGSHWLFGGHGQDEGGALDEMNDLWVFSR
jgi:N-acetylneuraminic acid mutarotase